MNNVVAGANRFRALLEGTGGAEHDRPLLETARWLVAPTLGAIVPGWLLIIPRRPVLNFKQWSVAEATRPELIIRELGEYLGLEEHDVIWFEHGPFRPSTSVGCGLDHAHIHFLVQPSFKFIDFEAAARSLSDFDWQRMPRGQGYAGLKGANSYLIAGSGENVITAVDVEKAGSQFFRRVVSKLAGESGWDYRRHPHSANVSQTVKQFELLERAAQRER